MSYNLSYISNIVFFLNDTATTEIYTLSLHDALPIYIARDSLPAPRIRSPAFLPPEKTAAPLELVTNARLAEAISQNALRGDAGRGSAALARGESRADEFAARHGWIPSRGISGSAGTATVAALA